MLIDLNVGIRRLRVEVNCDEQLIVTGRCEWHVDAHQQISLEALGVIDRCLAIGECLWVQRKDRKKRPGMNSHKVGLVIAPVVALAQVTNVDDHGLDQRQACITTGRLIGRKRRKIQGNAEVTGGGVETKVNGGLKLGMDLCVAHCNDFHERSP